MTDRDQDPDPFWIIAYKDDFVRVLFSEIRTIADMIMIIAIQILKSIRSSAISHPRNTATKGLKYAYVVAIAGVVTPNSQM